MRWTRETTRHIFVSDQVQLSLQSYLAKNTDLFCACKSYLTVCFKHQQATSGDLWLISLFTATLSLPLHKTTVFTVVGMTSFTRLGRLRWSCQGLGETELFCHIHDREHKLQKEERRRIKKHTLCHDLSPTSTNSLGNCGNPVETSLFSESYRPD